MDSFAARLNELLDDTYLNIMTMGSRASAPAPGWISPPASFT